LSQFGRKYVFPAEYDIFIDFAPVKYNRNSDEQPTSNGYLEISTYHTMTNPAPSGDATWTTVDRLETLATPGEYSNYSYDGATA
jgi:hypothetical protein